ncbi:MAG: VOC family protein [Acidimicrobiales bacterium]
MAVARLASTSLDCPEPAALADFWAALLGGEVAFRGDEFCAQTGNGWIAAVKVADYRPPTWPAEVPKQIHLDLATSDLEAAEAEALRLGARQAADQPAPDRWRVLFDPAATRSASPRRFLSEQFDRAPGHTRRRSRRDRGAPRVPGAHGDRC